MSDTDNPFAPLTKAEYAAMMAGDSTENAPADDGAESSEPQPEQQDRAAVLDAVERAEAKMPKRTVPRRRVTKTQIGHVAQDVLANALANVLGYWREDLSIRQRITELGVSEEQFHDALKRQADRAAKTLGFEEAWSA